MDTVTLPRIGEKAPDFQAQSTRGIVCFPSDYKGKWVVLMSHPGAFNPVCASELRELASLQNQFAEHNCALLAFSPDSSEAHAAWMRELEKQAGGEGVFAGIPLVADDGGVISRQYGVIASGASRPVRGVFMIDAKATVRAVLLYPRGVGRNMGEVFRLLLALQAYETDGMPLPANWNPLSKTSVHTVQPAAEQPVVQPEQTAPEENSLPAEQVADRIETQVVPDVQIQPAVAESEPLPSGRAKQAEQPSAGHIRHNRQQLRPISQSAWDALAEAEPQVPAQPAQTEPAISMVHTAQSVLQSNQVKPGTRPSAPAPVHSAASGSIADQNRLLLGDLIDKEDAENGKEPKGKDYLIMRDFPFKN